MAAVVVSAPGRVCFAGEDIDWISGPSILCAVDLRVVVTITRRSGPFGELVIQSGDPFNVERIFDWKALHTFSGHALDHIQAAVKVASELTTSRESLLIHADSNLPAGAGLASSAAVITATLTALSELWGLRLSTLQICELAYRAEAGELRAGVGPMDFYASALGGLLYINSATSPPTTERLPFPSEVGLVVADTLVRRRTADVIRWKRDRFERRDPSFLEYVRHTEHVVARMRTALESMRPPEEIGALICSCHEYLVRHMRVSTPLLDECVATAVRAGSYGAKLTGTGMGGCAFALTPRNVTPAVLAAWERLPVRPLDATPSLAGVLVGKAQGRLLSPHWDVR